MMYIKKINIVVIILFCSTVLCWSGEKVEHQIGPFNLAGSPITESQLISSFGPGYVKIDKVGSMILGKEHIYYDVNEKVWVAVSLSNVLDKKLERVVEAVLVSKKKLCDEKFKPRKLFGPLITGKGIKIGDTLDKIINTYGTPSVSIDIGKDRSFSVLWDDLKLRKGRVLRYLTNQPNELLFSEFYFDGGVLHSMLISAAE
jgi:hypothetical protein